MDLSFLRGYQFEHGVRMLERGYLAARDALHQELEHIQREAAEYETRLATGGEWIGEYEDGHLLWSQSQLFEANINDIQFTLFEVRKAFVIAIYHSWEDSVATWMGLKGDSVKHDALAEFCASKGYGPSPDLGAVQCLANFLKHGPNSRIDWLARLRKRHPSFLPESLTPMFGFSEDILFKVITTILASGPRTRTLYGLTGQIEPTASF